MEDLLPIPIKMPALSPTMTQGHLIIWHKNINDPVRTGDLLLEIETDKAVMEVEATQSGILDHLCVSAGTNDVPVGKIIAVLRTDSEKEGVGMQWLQEQGEEFSGAVASTSATFSSEISGAACSVSAVSSSDVSIPTATRTSEPISSPASDFMHSNLSFEPAADVLYPVSNFSSPFEQHRASLDNTEQKLLQERIIASPLARKWAQKHGLNLHHISGTGPRGRIVKEDVLSALSTPSRFHKNSQAAHAFGVNCDEKFQKSDFVGASEQSNFEQVAKGSILSPNTSELSGVFSSGSVSSCPTQLRSDDTSRSVHNSTLSSLHTTLRTRSQPVRIPLSGMRRTIAQRLTMSKQTVPHFSLMVECRMNALLALRKDMNGSSKDISVNDCMVRACAMALRAVPEMRVMWGDETYALKHEDVDLAVAVSIPGGLITPIVQCADHKSLRQISGELKALIARARQGQLSPAEYQGGLFTLSNLGMMGIDQFTPIINPPHTGILAIGATKKRPVVDASSALSVEQTMLATISADHRTIDGSVAATFLTTFQHLIEHPMQLVM